MPASVDEAGKSSHNLMLAIIVLGVWGMCCVYIPGEQRGSNLAAALSTGAAEREGTCPKATVSLFCPKHMEKLSLLAAASHGALPSCKPFTMLTTEKAAPSHFHQVSSPPAPCPCCTCIPPGQPGLCIFTVQNWILPWQVNAIALAGDFSGSVLITPGR